MSMTPVPHNNRTGSRLSEDWLKEMIEGTREFRPSSDGSAQAIVKNRMSYAKDGMIMGSYPPPGDPSAFKTAADRAPNEQTMDLFMDKLGARLAFERSGVRLYEGMIAKVDALGSFEGGPSVRDLEHICDAELSHFKLLRDCIERFGGDPTAMTPAADVQATLGKGASEIMADPRVGVIPCLDALMTAELADHASWNALVDIARQAGEPEAANQFEAALREEKEHLTFVEGWMASAVRQQTR